MAEFCANGHEIQTVLGMRVCVDTDKSLDVSGFVTGPTYHAPPCAHDDKSLDGFVVVKVEGRR